MFFLNLDITKILAWRENNNKFIFWYAWAGFDPSFKRPTCLTTLKSFDTTKLSLDDNIYAPPWGLSTLAKEFSTAACMIKSSSKELSTLVSGKV